MLWTIPFWLFKLVIAVSEKPNSLSSHFAISSYNGQQHDIVNVKLYTLGNSTIKAQITNIGNEHLHLVKSGSILDENRPTYKVNVEGSARFTGVRVDYIVSHLSTDAFVQLAPNQTIESVFDVARSHDLIPGERYSAVASGHLDYILSTVPNVFSSVAYTSNKVTIDAPPISNKAITSRATLTACGGQYSDAMRQALDRVAKMAIAAAQEAREGGERLKVYFGSDSPEVRKQVANRLDAIADEATSKGTVNYFCQDTKQECYGNIAALTFPYENRIINCPPYYDTPAVADQCHYLDQAGLSLHEFAHATSVYRPGAIDVAYGYDAVLKLNTQDALQNADSFAYYANSVFLNCAEDVEKAPVQPNGKPTGNGADRSSNTGQQQNAETGGTGSVNQNAAVSPQPNNGLDNTWNPGSDNTWHSSGPPVNSQNSDASVSNGQQAQPAVPDSGVPDPNGGWGALTPGDYTSQFNPDGNGVQSTQAPSNINDIATVENPAYDQMRQDWNNGQYVSGVDGFDDNNNPIFGDNGSYNAAL